VHSTCSHPRRKQTDGARGDEGGDARGAAEQIGDAHEPSEHRHRQSGVVDSSDNPEIPVTQDGNEDEPDRASTDDDRKKQRQIQGHLRFVDRDQNARPGRSQGNEGK
jgi:hypothetical protein